MYIPFSPELVGAADGETSTTESLDAFEPLRIPMPDCHQLLVGTQAMHQDSASQAPLPPPGLESMCGLEVGDLLPSDLIENFYEDMAFDQQQDYTQMNSYFDDMAACMEFYMNDGLVCNYAELYNQDPRKDANGSFSRQRAKKIMGQEVARLALKMSSKNNRWWATSRKPLTCPLSHFPISLLPYPPFKLWVQDEGPNPHILVDGKFLALHLISTGNLRVNGRYLQPAEVNALEWYIHRCKLGNYRPEHAMTLADIAANPALSCAERQQASQELQQLRSIAKWEFAKLKYVQEQRLKQVHRKLTAGKGIHIKEPKRSSKASEQQVHSGASTCSGSGKVSDVDSNSDASNVQACPVCEDDRCVKAVCEDGASP